MGRLCGHETVVVLLIPGCVKVVCAGNSGCVIDSWLCGHKTVVVLLIPSCVKVVWA